MRLGDVGVSMVGTVAIVSLVLAVASVWLLLTDPVTVATVVTGGEVSPFLRDLLAVIVAMLRDLLEFL